MKGIFFKFNQTLQLHPIRTKFISGLVLAGVGDASAQMFEAQRSLKRKKETEHTTTTTLSPLKRLLVFSLFGASWTGIVNHYWLKNLASRFPASDGLSSLGKKLMIQHLLFNPLVYFPYYFAFIGLGSGLSWTEFKSWVRKDYWGMMAYCVVFWLPITTLVFLRVPEIYQSILMSAISLVWNTFLSWKSF